MAKQLEVNESMVDKGQLPNETRVKIKKLARRFVLALPERVENLHEVLIRLNCERSKQKDFYEARNEAHKLSGSGATFGFGALSNLAREIELILDLRIEEGGGLTDDERKEVDALTKNLGIEIDRIQREAAEEQRRLPPHLPEAEPEQRYDEKRRIILWDSDSHIIEDLTYQLEHFGFSIITVKNTEELKKSLEDEGTAVLIVCAFDFMANPEAADDFQAFRHGEYGEQFKVIFLCEQDDFDIRLFAVRQGGDAFFSFPFDISRLIASIDELSHSRELEPFHVLIVDDDPEQISFYAMILQKAGMITSVVSDPRNVIQVLVEFKPELILMDLYMPDCNGKELAALIRQQEAFVGIPIVYLSVEQDLEKQLAAIKTGGDGFLTKPIQSDHLVTEVAIRVERTRKIRYFMERDSLTGLLNHSQLLRKLSDDVNRSRRLGTSLCFAMIDIDHFKSVNDNYGHLTGDRVLKSLAKLLLERLRKTDTVGRYGGEEFGVILFNTDLQNSYRIMDEIRQDFSEMRQRENKEDFFISFSCGISVLRPGVDSTELCDEADKAMYRAKHKGRNRVEVALALEDSP